MTTYENITTSAIVLPAVPATIYDVPYNPVDVKIYSFIASRPDKLALTTEVISMYYGERELPINARIIVGGMLNALAKKLTKNRARLVLKKSPRRGPYPIIWYLVPRRGRAARSRSARQ